MRRDREHKLDLADIGSESGAATHTSTLAQPGRSAISPWIDRRKTVDIIRDKLDARGAALLRESKLMS